MKPIWKGSLTFGLVTFPIKVYSAIQSTTLGFRLLHAKCHTPLEYQRYCPHCKKVIEWKDVVRGAELPDGTFFIITEEKLEALKPAKSDSIEIVEFINEEQIAPIYFDEHYYVAPGKVTNKAYFLFTESLQKLHVVGIAKFVLREKEYVCAIAPYENGILLSTLHYQYEIRPIENIETLSVTVVPKVTKEERKLAEELIGKMSKKTFDMKPFKDTFVEQIHEQILRAAAGKKLLAHRARKAIGKKVPENLLETLKKSLKKTAETRKGRARR
jgi:DNA end-binding protein Ku